MIKLYQAYPIPTSSLEPFLDKNSLQLHYQLYLENLNKLNTLLHSINYDYSHSMKYLINHIDLIPLFIRGEVLYYLSSILNHNLYFYNLTSIPQQPIGSFAQALNKNFTNYPNFQQEFTKQALNLKGSGYTFLVMEPTGNLKIINTSNEDSPYYYGFTPIIALDLWEHAYYPKYNNNRTAYINNFFKVLDFNKINRYYERLKTEPPSK